MNDLHPAESLLPGKRGLCQQRSVEAVTRKLTVKIIL
jgi:hypothetical protein